MVNFFEEIIWLVLLIRANLIKAKNTSILDKKALNKGFLT